MKHITTTPQLLRCTLCVITTLFAVWAVTVHAHTTTDGEISPDDTHIEIEARAEGEIEAHDADSDGDGLDDGSEESATDSDVDNGNNGQAGSRGEPSITKEIDKASPELMQRLDVDQSSPLLYQGVSVRANSTVCPSDNNDCDDEDAEVHPASAHVHVSGKEVRNWNEEQKAEVQQRLQAADEVNSANDFGIRVASAALENEEVVDIDSDQERTEVTYSTRVRFLGFIPVTVTARAVAEADGEARVSHPWYTFLARKNDDSERFSSLATDLRAAHDAFVAISVEEEGAPVNRREEDTSDSSN